MQSNRSVAIGLQLDTQFTEKDPYKTAHARMFNCDSNKNTTEVRTEHSKKHINTPMEGRFFMTQYDHISADFGHGMLPVPSDQQETNQKESDIDTHSQIHTSPVKGIISMEPKQKQKV